MNIRLYMHKRVADQVVTNAYIASLDTSLNNPYNLGSYKTWVMLMSTKALNPAYQRYPVSRCPFDKTDAVPRYLPAVPMLSEYSGRDACRA